MVNYEDLINELLRHLVNRYNDYSQLVAINYHKKHDEGTLQWNRGSKDVYKEEAEELAQKLGRKVEYALKTEKILADTPEEYEVEYLRMSIKY